MKSSQEVFIEEVENQGLFKGGWSWDGRKDIQGESNTVRYQYSEVDLSSTWEGGNFKEWGLTKGEDVLWAHTELKIMRLDR